MSTGRTETNKGVTPVKTKLATAAGGAALAVALAACASPVISKATPPTTTATAVPAAATATPTPAEITSGVLGTTFTVTTEDESGNSVKYDVTLTQVDQHAGLSAYQTLTNPADHMAAARFTVKGVTGQENDDANSDATAVSSDTTEYPPSFNGTADGPNFDGGDFTVAPGESVSGWVAFELAPGQTVTSVKWAPSGGFGTNTHATWTVRP